MKKKLLITISILFAISSVLTTIESVTSGAEVASLRTKEASLSAEKRDLQGNLVKTVSVSDLEEKGLSLGFSKPSDLIYLGESTNVANKN